MDGQRLVCVCMVKRDSGCMVKRGSVDAWMHGQKRQRGCMVKTRLTCTPATTLPNTIQVDHGWEAADAAEAAA